MPPSESTPLLNGNGSHSDTTFIGRVKTLIAAEGEPSWIASYRFFLFGSYLNLFLLFVPLSIISHHLNWDAALRFSFSFIAIIPLAKLLGEATEQMSAKLGQTLAGLLNASFGNAVEIIVGIAALLQGELRIVQTSMLGSILSNLLLVLAGFKFKESNFQVTAAQASSSLMTLACITLVIPAAYQSTLWLTWHPTSGLLVISRGTALLLLGVYVAYLVFQLKTHAYLFEAEEQEAEQPHMSVVAAGVALLGTTVVTSFCADYCERRRTRYFCWMAMKGQMELTIGICVGSSIQIATFVIPLLVIVGWIAGPGHELTLFFANFETISLFVSVFLVNTLIQQVPYLGNLDLPLTFLCRDGKSNYMEGLMLVTLYFVIALAFWVS
ncbi:Sodium/calcium exchanger protein-domain-containing protein [Mycena olivaceomarginata]|nr:Sodium/calcium exchanger protein-domain-containing protein [Mycena olivaceomarginata]